MKNTSLATVINEPVLLARQMCPHCHGRRVVPTPEFAGWQATVERFKDGGADGNAAYGSARRQAGDPPQPETATCQGCEGRGYNETEVDLGRLQGLLDKGTDQAP
jgi:hypothetical protein